MDERVYMVAGEDQVGDQHVFMSEDRERAIATYRDMKDRFLNVRPNPALAEVLRAKRGD